MLTMASVLEVADGIRMKSAYLDLAAVITSCWCGAQLPHPDMLEWCVQAAAAGTSEIGTTVVGTYGYMAPEQFRGAASPASDLYGLGGTLLFLLSGAMAYTTGLFSMFWFSDQYECGGDPAPVCTATQSCASSSAPYPAAHFCCSTDHL